MEIEVGQVCLGITNLLSHTTRIANARHNKDHFSHTSGSHAKPTAAA